LQVSELIRFIENKLNFFFSLVLVASTEFVSPSQLVVVVVPPHRVSVPVLPIFVAAPTILALLRKVVALASRLLPVPVPMSLVIVLGPLMCSVVSVEEEDALLDPRSTAVVIPTQCPKD
jgi:hypothetical protein